MQLKKKKTTIRCIFTPTFIQEFRTSQKQSPWGTPMQNADWHKYEIFSHLHPYTFSELQMSAEIGVLNPSSRMSNKG